MMLPTMYAYTRNAQDFRFPDGLIDVIPS